MSTPNAIDPMIAQTNITKLNKSAIYSTLIQTPGPSAFPHVCAIRMPRRAALRIGIFAILAEMPLH
jgi:hypothetical protein